MVSSSSATNPMDNAAMFCRTQFLRFTGPDLCKIGKITHFRLTSLKRKGDKRRHTQSHSLWSVVAVLQIPRITPQYFVGPNFYVLQVRTCAK